MDNTHEELLADIDITWPNELGRTRNLMIVSCSFPMRRFQSHSTFSSLLIEKNARKQLVGYLKYKTSSKCADVENGRVVIDRFEAASSTGIRVVAADIGVLQIRYCSISN